MLDGKLLVDAHTHVGRLPSTPDWISWASEFGGRIPTELFDADGAPHPKEIDEHFARQGVDHVLLFTEHSPKVAVPQPIEDVLPLVEFNPARFHTVANINPHLHYPIARELARQVSLGAIACKIHPVHGGFAANDRMVYPAYSWAEERGIPVVVHSGTSIFAGSANNYADPALLAEVFRDFPELTVVLAHGGRGWWYDECSFQALARPNVWIDISGLPPHRLPDYYGRSLRRLSSKLIFGTDWPGVPGVDRNARAVENVLLEADCTADEVAAVWAGNAARVYGLGAQ